MKSHTNLCLTGTGTAGYSASVQYKMQKSILYKKQHSIKINTATGSKSGFLIYLSLKYFKYATNSNQKYIYLKQ